MLEKNFQTACLKKLRTIPVSHWIKINDRTTIGLPDTLGWMLGESYAIEWKTGSQVTKIQQYTLDQLADAGVRTFVVCPENWQLFYIALLSRHRLLTQFG